MLSFLNSIFAQNQSTVPLILGLPIEKEINPNEITITWKSNVTSISIVHYGKINSTKIYTDSIFIDNKTTSHAIKISNLESATMYNCIVGSRDSTGTSYSKNFIFSTASPASTSGAMWVYFSKNVNTTVSNGENAKTTNLANEFVKLINLAQYSIDICLYSLSGNVGSQIVNALIDAKNRGVKIRFIGEEDNSSSVAITSLKNSGIPFITDNFDPLGSGGYMHNKFGIFDNRNNFSDADDILWTGSWNATDSGTNNDDQNVVVIQDVALANAYTREFEEMWGSSTETPNQTVSRFGSRKTNNTPHRFMINSVPVELFFSPSDATTSQIYNLLASSSYSINVALLSFTRDDLSQIIISKKNNGVKARVLMDNNSDTGNEYLNLLNAGVDVYVKPNSISGYLHHKYVIVDAENNSPSATVLTGSHNWSTSAENSNNENTLIINSRRIANLYLQEFKARYLEIGGKENITLTAIKNNDRNKLDFNFQIYPNPANPTTTIQFNVDKKSFVNLNIYSISGQKVETILEDEFEKGIYKINYKTNKLSSGIYYCKIMVDKNIKVLPLILIK
ncbi:MAG: phospholipase D-like domain-containing protein [Bacteroidetes bacterium]|nr:phospholipase D-like domain-containing protein [Bacteroidota bacterium]